MFSSPLVSVAVEAAERNDGSMSQAVSGPEFNQVVITSDNLDFAFVEELKELFGRQYTERLCLGYCLRGERDSRQGRDRVSYVTQVATHTPI